MTLPIHTFKFCTKFDGEFVPDNHMIHVATEHVQCTGLAECRAGRPTVSANERQAQILKECVNQ